MFCVVAINYSCTTKANKREINATATSPIATSVEFDEIILKSVRKYTTSKAGNLRLTESEGFLIGDFIQPDEHFPTLILDAKKRFQEIQG